MIDIDCSIFVALFFYSLLCRSFFFLFTFFVFLVLIVHLHGQLSSRLMRWLILVVGLHINKNANPSKSMPTIQWMRWWWDPKIDPYKRFHEQEITQQIVWVLLKRVKYIQTERAREKKRNHISMCAHIVLSRAKTWYQLNARTFTNFKIWNDGSVEMRTNGWIDSRL